MNAILMSMKFSGILPLQQPTSAHPVVKTSL
jgi:hypothetical protein